jgi:hypothetical protein
VRRDDGLIAANVDSNTHYRLRHCAFEPEDLGMLTRLWPSAVVMRHATFDACGRALRIDPSRLRNSLRFLRTFLPPATARALSWRTGRQPC